MPCLYRNYRLIMTLCVCAIIAGIVSVGSCSSKGPTDLNKLKKIVASQTPKDEMDLVHKAHEKAGIDCYQCHHKWENPDRIRNCTNCHRGKEEEIARGICVKCHEKSGGK